MMTITFRGLAWALIAAIFDLSLVPPSLRPVISAPHDFEHFAIFALCGVAFGLGYRAAYLFQATALVAFSGLIEILQLLTPGRHARMIDFTVDAIAICVGVLIAWLVLKISSSNQWH